MPVPATRMKRFWTMLAHWHGQKVNMSSLGKSLEVDNKTVNRTEGNLGVSFG